MNVHYICTVYVYIQHDVLIILLPAGNALLGPVYFISFVGTSIVYRMSEEPIVDAMTLT